MSKFSPPAAIQMSPLELVLLSSCARTSPAFSFYLTRCEVPLPPQAMSMHYVNPLPSRLSMRFQGGLRRGTVRADDVITLIF